MKLSKVSSFRRRLHFSIHVEDHGNSDAILLAYRLASFDLAQHVTGATHKFGGTFDLIITGSDVAFESVEVDPPGIISDHGLVSCCILIQSYAAKQSEAHISLPEAGGECDRPTLFEAIRSSPIGGPPASSDPDHLLAV